MKTVKVLNFKGNVYEGTWNEKIYESKNENKDLARIYVNNEAIHITKEELAKIVSNIENCEKQLKADKSKQTKIKILELLEDLTFEDKKELLDDIMCDHIQSGCKARSFSELHKAFYNLELK